jgi:predicted MFS family arabinose efflux permease
MNRLEQSVTIEAPAFPSPGRLVAIVCAAEVLGMAPFSMFLALQPNLKLEWSLSNTAAGWISGSYYAGYMLAVPLLASLTDRYDARSVWLAATAIGAAAAAGFALAADGLWTAFVWQFLAGISLAGTYMPGLKMIADRMPGVPHPRHVAFYTTSFTIGSSLSFFAVGQLAALYPWRVAIGAIAAGPVVAWLLGCFGLRAASLARGHAEAGDRHWQQVARSGSVMRYVLAYACHTWELFAMRAWLVPFLTFANLAGAPASATTLAALVGLVGVPASLAGAELSARLDRRRLVVSIMLLSVAISLLFGLSSSQPWYVVLALGVLYSAFISADSAALTSGVIAVSPPRSRGTAMAIYSTAGFAAASAGSVAIGVVLDLAGGQSSATWAVAFALIGVPNLVGAAFLLRGRE